MSPQEQDVLTTLPTTEPDTRPVLEPEPMRNAFTQINTWVETVSDPHWWVSQAERVLLVLVVLTVAILVLRLASRIIGRVQKQRRLPDAVVVPLRRFIRWAVLIIAGLLLLQWFGVDISTIWASLSAVLALIAVGFIAVWSVLSNVACSVMLLIFKPFRIGDFIELYENPGGENVCGRVKDVTMMYVVLREEGSNGALIQIPNNLFFQKTIRRQETTRSIPLEDHVDRHGLTGKEARRPSSIDVKPRELA